MDQTQNIYKKKNQYKNNLLLKSKQEKNPEGIEPG